MIDIVSTMQGILRDAGFVTHLTYLEHSPLVSFENDTLIGFGFVFENPRVLLDDWKTTEKSILIRYAPNIRSAGEKAWNVYCVFLSGSAADPTESRQVRWIEEDLEHTRKLVGCGLGTREDLVKSLLPLLPLQYQPVLRAEDVTQRLETRMRSITPKGSHVVLDEAVPTSEVVRLLGEQE